MPTTPEQPPVVFQFLPILIILGIALAVFVWQHLRKAKLRASAREAKMSALFYYLSDVGEVAGPASLGELSSMFSSEPDKLVCAEGSQEWLPLGATIETAQKFLLPEDQTSDKRILVAALLCFFLGTLGFHAFYVERRGRGLVMFVLGVWLTVCLATSLRMLGDGPGILLFTVPVLVFVVMWLGDMLNLLLGRYVDGNGYTLRRW